MRRFTGRDIGGSFVSLIGVGIVGSGIFMSPWMARATSGAQAIDRLDVLAQYSAWSIPLGIVVIALGVVFTRSTRLDNALLLILVLVAVVLGDRFLLANFGLPLWEHDSTLNYRHRPGARRLVNPLLGNTDVYAINQQGHHDDEFPVAKPKGELRGLLLGDSVTMGYGVTRDHTFAAHLERIAHERDQENSGHQFINAGVHGYATAQELEVLERSLHYGPDFIVLGFCMNDLTEPFVVDAELGGTGIDYHAVSQTPNAVVGWVINETGTGRLIQRIQARGKTLESEKLAELFDVRAMAEKSETEPRFIESWRMTKASLEQIYAVAAKEKKPLVVLILPFTFQLLGDESRRTPQRILTAHAAEHSVDVIDLTPVFRDAVYDDPELLALMQTRYDADEIEQFYRWKLSEYFLDEDHFTSKGNRLIAEHIYRWLQREGLVTETATGAVTLDR